MKTYLKKTSAIFTMIAIIVISLLAFEKPVWAADSAKLDMSLDSKGILTVKGYSPDENFHCLMIDEGKTDEYYSGINGEKNFTFKIDTKKYAIGYHTLSAKLYDSGKVIYAEKAFPSLIYDKETIKKNSNFLIVGSNFVVFTPYFTVNNDAGVFYAQMGKGNSWKGVFGPFTSYSGKKITKLEGSTKLKPNTTYKIRAFYYKNTKYGGTSYPFIGPYSNVITFKTGKAKAPKIKSISAKCVSQKKKKLYSPGRWDAGGVWHPAYSGTTWETKFKVTVKLKKKPGTKGVYIGGKKVKGNKKTYKVTITSSGKLKGKKIKVGVCSYNDNKVGSYSPEVKKAVKIK